MIPRTPPTRTLAAAVGEVAADPAVSGRPAWRIPGDGGSQDPESAGDAIGLPGLSTRCRSPD